MKNITVLFEEYREAARHLRNTYFKPQNNSDWDTLEDYQEIEVILFKKMVLKKLEIDENIPWIFHQPLQYINAKSRSNILPIMINRDKQSGYWDHPLNEVKKNDLTLNFIGYFDWDTHSHIDFRYYKVRIAQSQKYPEIIGYDALIETIYADIYYQKWPTKKST